MLSIPELSGKASPSPHCCSQPLWLLRLLRRGADRASQFLAKASPSCSCRGTLRSALRGSPGDSSRRPAQRRRLPICQRFAALWDRSGQRHDFDIQFEVWMPLSGWNNKFLSAGEGGFAGAINYAGMADALRRGYAGGSTDTGMSAGPPTSRQGTRRRSSTSAGAHITFRPRARKKIISAFYGERIRHSYFSSCSNGGRQAMMELQRFPEDFDGVIVGAPAHDWTHLFAGFRWNEQALWNTPGQHPSRRQPCCGAGRHARQPATTSSTG